MSEYLLFIRQCRRLVLRSGHTLLFVCVISALAALPNVAYAVSPHLGGGGSDTCSTCHVPHQAATTRSILGGVDDPSGEVPLCLSCHDGSGASSDIEDGPDSFGLSSGHVLEDVDDPLSMDLTNACSGCHSPHGDPALKPKLPGSSVNSVTALTADNEWCFACHNDAQDWYAKKGSYPALESPSLDASGYPVAGVFAGRSVYVDPAANAHVSIPASGSIRETGDCLYCHNAHGSASSYDSLVATFAPSTPSSAAQDRATGAYAALCLGCHDGGSWETSGAANVKQYVTQGAADEGWNATGGHRIKSAGGKLPVNAPLPCYDCHNPHGSNRGNTTLLSDALGGSLDTSSTPEGVRQFCLSCHVTSDVLGWDSAGGTYAAVSSTATVEGLLRNGGASGSGPDGGYNWLRLKPLPGHQGVDVAESCYDCHGNDYADETSKNVHAPGLYNAEQHTPGGPCVTSGCHAADANTIHAAGPRCTACHAIDVTPSLVCAECHVGDQHPSANHVNSTLCYGCHAEENLMSVHGDDCSTCHPAPAEGMTYAGGCSQTGCHASAHPDPWPTATYQQGHSQIGWGHSNYGSDCWECHEVNSWEGTSCTTPFCHPHVYEKVAPTTTSDAAGPYVGGAVILLTATDAGGYWGGPDPQWFISGVRQTYFQVNGGELQTGTTVIVTPPSTGTAVNTIEFWSTDNNYNTEAHNIIKVATMAVDGGDKDPPMGTMSVNADAIYSGVTAVTVGSAVTDPGSGVWLMRLDPGTGFYGSWTTYATSRAATLASGDGVKTVRAQYMDGGGNVLTFSDSIVLDSTPPSGSVVVNGGAADTAVTGVTLNSSVSDVSSSVSQMRFSNNNITWSSWEAYSSTKSWTLTAGNAVKTVYAQYRDVVGNTSVTYSDTILLYDGVDLIPPTGSVTVNWSAPYATSTAVTLQSSATDTGGSGLSQMRFSNDNSTWSSWETYATTKSWTLTSGNGAKAVYAQYRDGTGNSSATYVDTITLDAAAPTGSVVIAGGAANTSMTQVSLTLAAVDTGGSGLSQMRFSNDNTTWSTWETYSSTRGWALTLGDGVKTVYAQYRDAAGNVSSTYSDTITFTAGTTATLAFRWWGYGDADLRVENSSGVTIASTHVAGSLEDLSWYVNVPAGQNYRMICDYYWDDDRGDEGGGYGIWSNDVSINPDGVLSPGETVTWNY